MVSSLVRSTIAAGKLVAVLATIVLAGCGGGGKPASVTGEVSFGGTAIENGSIRFDAMGDTQGDPAAAKIVAGKYEIPRDAGLKAGTYRVSVTGSQSAGRRTDPETGQEVEVMRELIPEKYNLLTELTAELVAGENQKDFPLEP